MSEAYGVGRSGENSGGKARRRDHRWAEGVAVYTGWLGRPS